MMGFQIAQLQQPAARSQLLTPNELGEDVEGMLVRQWLPILRRRDRPSGTSTFSGIGQNAPICLCGTVVPVGDPVPGGLVDLIGVSARSTTPATRPWVATSAARGSGDLVPSTTIDLTSGVEQQASRLTDSCLSWSTNLAGEAAPRWPGGLPALGSFGRQRNPGHRTAWRSPDWGRRPLSTPRAFSGAGFRTPPGANDAVQHGVRGAWLGAEWSSTVKWTPACRGNVAVSARSAASRTPSRRTSTLPRARWTWPCTTPATTRCVGAVNDALAAEFGSMDRGRANANRTPLAP